MQRFVKRIKLLSSKSLIRKIVKCKILPKFLSHEFENLTMTIMQKKFFLHTFKKLEQQRQKVDLKQLAIS